MPTIFFSSFTMQAPTCVLGSFDLIEERMAMLMK